MAQMSFTPSRTQINIQNRGIDEPIFYSWSDLTNNDTTDLNLRWVIVQNDLPSQWESFVEDPDSAYLVYKDSADFVLPAVQPFPDKLIVSFNPNWQAGRATVTLKVYNVNDPADSVLITWRANAIELSTGVVVLEESVMQVYPNPTNGPLFLKGDDVQAQVYNLLGELIMKGDEHTCLNLNGQHAGTYIVKLTDKSGQTLTRKVLYQP